MSPAVLPDGSLTLPGIEPLTLDPALSADSASSEYLSLLYDGLVRFDRNGGIKPAIADHWAVSADGKRYTFHIRANARFQDGTPVTAASFRYALDRATDPALKSPGAGTYLGDIVGVRTRLEGKAPTVSGVKVIDPQTLEIDLRRASSIFLERLTYPTADPLDATTVSQGGSGWWRHPNGTGPYRLESWSPGQRLVLVRDPHYTGTAVKLAKITFVFDTDPKQYLTAYQNGSFDMVPVIPDALPLVFDTNSQLLADARVYDMPSLTYLGFNVRVPPFNDGRVREAVALGIDRMWIIHNVLGSGVPLATGLIPPGIPGYDSTITGYPYDVAAGRQLLAQAYPGGTPPMVLLDSISGSSVVLGREIAAMLKTTIGVQVTAEPLQHRSLAGLRTSGGGQAQLFLTGWQADYPDPQDFVDLLYRTGSAENYGGFSDPAVDQLIQQASVAATEQTRIAIYQAAEQRLLREAAAVPLWYDRQYYLIHPYVGGVVLQPTGGFNFRKAFVRQH